MKNIRDGSEYSSPKLTYVTSIGNKVKKSRLVNCRLYRRPKLNKRQVTTDRITLSSSVARCYMAEILPIWRKTLSNQSINLIYSRFWKIPWYSFFFYLELRFLIWLFIWKFIWIFWGAIYGYLNINSLKTS